MPNESNDTQLAKPEEMNAGKEKWEKPELRTVEIEDTEADSVGSKNDGIFQAFVSA